MHLPRCKSLVPHVKSCPGCPTSVQCVSLAASADSAHWEGLSHLLACCSCSSTTASALLSDIALYSHLLHATAGEGLRAQRSLLRISQSEMCPSLRYGAGRLAELPLVSWFCPGKFLPRLHLIMKDASASSVET